MSLKHAWAVAGVAVFFLTVFIFYGCTKNNDATTGPYDINNFLTLFKVDNINNDKDILPADTIASASGLQGKYIPVSGNTGAAAGLGKISFQLFTTDGSLLSSTEKTSFYRPEYDVFNIELSIPDAAKGQVYKIVVASFDKDSNKVDEKSFYGIDVLSCDPLPDCIVSNQITIMLETPDETPEDEPLYIFGSINGWGSRDEAQYMFHKNPDMANCYCLSIAYPPGYADWQLTQIFVSRGSWDTQAVTASGDDTYWDYTTTAGGSIWKISVVKWRDK